VFDSETGVEFNVFLIYELPTVVDYDSMWNSISTYDVFP